MTENQLKPALKLYFNNSWIYIIFAIALFLRFLYFFEVFHTPVLEFLQIDSDYYHKMGLAIANGDLLFGKRIFTMAPLYGYFLALIYIIGGKSFLNALIIQIFIGSLSCVLIYLLADKYFNKKTAVLAGIISAIYPIFIFYDVTLLKENLMIFFTLIFAILYPSEIKTFPGEQKSSTFPVKNIVLVLICGFCTGIHALMRPNIFAIIPLLMLYEYYLKKDPVYLAKKFAILLIGIFIIVFPVSLRNKIVAGEWVITVASTGMNFWTGNNESSNGTYQGASFITSEEPQYEDEDFRKEASKRSGKQLDQKQASDFWFNEGLKFIKSNPKRYLWLLYRKLLGFFHNTELPTDLNYYFAKDFSKSLRLNFLSFGIVTPFAILGIFYTLWSRAGGGYLLIFLILYNFVSSMIFFNTSRYRLPTVPIFIIYAAFFIIITLFPKQKLPEDIAAPDPKLAKKKHDEKNQKHKKLNPLIALISLAILFVFINGKDRIFDDISSKSLSYLNSASYYMRNNKLDEAELMIKKALEIDPTRALVHKTYYEYYLIKGDKENAKKELELALQYGPSSGHKIAKPGTPEEAYSFFMKKDYAKALEIFRSQLGKNPAEEKELRNNIGLCLMRLQQMNEAEKEFKKALAIDNNYDKAYYNLGLLFEMKRDRQSAIEYYNKAVSSNPKHKKAFERIKSLSKQ